MRFETLPYTGPLALGFKLRKIASQAITAVETQASVTPGGRSESARLLQVFFTACANACAAVANLALPTVTTRVRTAANTAVVTFSEALQSTSSVPVSAFTFTPARVVTAVVVSGTTVTVTATGTIVGDTIAYTPPNGGQRLADAQGGEVAAFSGVLA